LLLLLKNMKAGKSNQATLFSITRLFLIIQVITYVY
jgi:hypothetical protein